MRYEDVRQSQSHFLYTNSILQTKGHFATAKYVNGTQFEWNYYTVQYKTQPEAILMKLSNQAKLFNPVFSNIATSYSLFAGYSG